MFGAACILFKVILYTIHKITKQSRKTYEKQKIEALNATKRKTGQNGFDNAAFTLDNGGAENSNDRLHKKLWLDVGSDANLRWSQIIVTVQFLCNKTAKEKERAWNQSASTKLTWQIEIHMIEYDLHPI